MNKPFGSTSLKRLEKVHPDLKRLALAVNEIWQCTIFSGGRTDAEQADFFYGTNKTGINPERKKLTKTLQSKHLIQADGFAHAIDWGPDPVQWENPQYNLDLIYFHGFVMAKAREMGIRIRYGGDWDRDGHISDESFQDTDHTELEDV